MTEIEIDRFLEIAKSFEIGTDKLLSILERSEIVQSAIEYAVEYMYERDLDNE